MGLAHLQRLAQLRRPLGMTEEQAAELEDDDRCIYCLGFHRRACPKVRSLDFHPNGNLARVVYFRADEIDWSGVLFDDIAPETVGSRPGGRTGDRSRDRSGASRRSTKARQAAEQGSPGPG